MGAGSGGGSPEPAPREARDVMAFGQETGRALSDGRIVGRAEPFAKVFPSSRAVKRAVGAMAWAVLEDIALDARIDDVGRLVSETNVRRIAENLALNKDTVTRHLTRLREHGFVLQEEARADDSGRWEPCRYVLDPSACVERFTTTPSTTGGPGENPRFSPCPKISDTDERAAVSEHTGHGEFGHHKEHRDVVEQHATRARAGAREAAVEPGDAQTAVADRCDEVGHVRAGDADADADADGFQSADGSGPGHAAAAPALEAANEPGAQDGDDGGLRARLIAAGVAGHVADDLIARYPRPRIEKAVAVAAAELPRNAAGWIVTALRDSWDLTDRMAESRQSEPEPAPQAEAHETRVTRLQHERAEKAQARAAEQHRADGWSQAVSAALDDAQLAAAVELATTPTPHLGRRPLPVAHSQLMFWAAHVATRFSDRPLAVALSTALAQRLDLREEIAAAEGLPDPPEPGQAPSADLRERLRRLLDPDSPSASITEGAPR